MVETLLSPSRVLMYGRVLQDLVIAQKASDLSPGLGGNKHLEEQIDAGFADNAKKARIARIYAFSYEGHFYDLAKPALFLVHGPGEPAEIAIDDPKLKRASRAPESADKTGVAATGLSFSEDIQVWPYDKSDLSIRLDVETGTLEQILLDVELSTDRLGLTFSGKTVRLRGSD
jgi:hypothetical protein